MQRGSIVRAVDVDDTWEDHVRSLIVLLEEGYNFMALRLLDALTFPISKMLETLFDKVEYKLAKMPPLEQQDNVIAIGKSYSREATRGSYEFQDGLLERRSLSGLR